MEGKKGIKISLSTLFLIIAKKVIAIMGFYMYKICNTKEATINTKTSIASNENVKNTQVATSYNKNFSESVFNKLAELSKQGEEEKIEATIRIPIWVYNNFSCISINSKHEAYWYNQGSENSVFPETSNSKVADNVINAWYCLLRQSIESNACLLFLKEDGSVTYIRFYLDSDNGVSFVNCTKEKKLNGISDISNVLVVEGGAYGSIFIKEDGTAMTLSVFELEDLTMPETN